MCVCVLTQWCPTLCDPMDCSRPGSSVHGDSPRKEYWSGLPCPSAGDLPNPGIEPRSPTLQVDSLPSEPQGRSGEAQMGERFQSSQPGARATVSTKSVMTLTLAYSGPTPPLPQAQGREQGPGVAVAVKGTDSEKTGTA